MFSVIIPLYNKSQYIQKAIDSVFLQTFHEYELIIVNDGSTDESLELIHQISKSTNQQINILNQPNSGVSTARNNGVKAARYDYIAFLDADDWWDPSFLMEMKLLIEEYPKAGVYGSMFYIVKNRINKPAIVGLPGNFKKGYIDYFQTYANTFCTPFNCSFVVVSKEAFNKVGGFNPKLKFGEDFDLWVRIALLYIVGYINKPLAFSNQDVVIANRALGGDKIYHPYNHFIFNLNFLSGIEKTRPEVKYLLDGLRVRSLLRYYLAGEFKTDTIRELQKIDFNLQPMYYRNLYIFPKILVKSYFWVKKIGSRIKQIIN